MLLTSYKKFLTIPENKRFKCINKIVKMKESKFPVILFTSDRNLQLKNPQLIVPGRLKVSGLIRKVRHQVQYLDDQFQNKNLSLLYYSHITQLNI